MITLRIDDQKIEVAEGTNLLHACLANNIYIPNLCYIAGMEHPPVSCRLCFVEIEGRDHPVSSCSVWVGEALVVHTDTPTVRQLQKTALQLLLSVHDVDCKNCPANRNCALQNMAKFLKVALKSKNFGRHLKEARIDEGHPFFNYYPNLSEPLCALRKVRLCVPPAAKPGRINLCQARDRHGHQLLWSPAYRTASL